MVKNSFSKVISIVKLIRPLHWIKNLGIFAAIIFTGQLLEPLLLISLIEGFIALCAVSSGAYVLNDLMDRERDKKHPIKKNRPISSGAIKPTEALIILCFLFGFGFLIANMISPLFFLLVVGYSLIQLSYSIYLKNIAVLDIILIATGFVIRVYAGAYIIDAHLSVWFHLCIISTALFLASGKRRAELSVVGREAGTRISLSKYNLDTLNGYVTMFANASWMSWSLFTFFESPRASQPLILFLSEISKATTINKLLMVTIPITIFGIMRYQALIFQDKTEAPEKVLIKDPFLLIAIISWVLVVLLIYYGGVSV